MKLYFILQVLVGLVLLTINKGQPISQLSCASNCTCSDICPEANYSFGCITCISPSCFSNGQLLTFSFTCDNQIVIGTYENTNQSLQYTSTTINNSTN